MSSRIEDLLKKYQGTLFEPDEELVPQEIYFCIPHRVTIMVDAGNQPPATCQMAAMDPSLPCQIELRVSYTLPADDPAEQKLP